MNNNATEAAKPDELRKNNRIDYYSKIQCTKSVHNGETDEYNEPVELMLINVSVGGLGIICDRHFEKDTILFLNIKLGEESFQKVSAKVMWTIKKGDMYRHGLEISNMSGKLYRHLSQLDNSIIATV